MTFTTQFLEMLDNFQNNKAEETISNIRLQQQSLKEENKQLKLENIKAKKEILEMKEIMRVISL